MEQLFDEMDCQRAVMAYLWAMPQMVSQGQLDMHHQFGVESNFDFLVQYQDPSVLGMLTPNTVVKYLSSA